MEKQLNTTYEFEFDDGTKVKMTLTFHALYQWKNRNRSLYDRYNRIMTKGASEELDMITVLYTAYCCAKMNSNEKIMTEEEFIIKCGYDRKKIRDAMEALTGPKKR